MPASSAKRRSRATKGALVKVLGWPAIFDGVHSGPPILPPGRRRRSRRIRELSWWGSLVAGQDSHGKGRKPLRSLLPFTLWQSTTPRKSPEPFFLRIPLHRRKRRDCRFRFSLCRWRRQETSAVGNGVPLQSNGSSRRLHADRCGSRLRGNTAVRGVHERIPVLRICCRRQTGDGR